MYKTTTDYLGKAFLILLVATSAACAQVEAEIPEAQVTEKNLSFRGAEGWGSVVGDVSVTHTFTLTNTGLVTDSFSLSVAGNTWPTTVMATTGELGPGEATTVDVVVTIPNEIGSDTFTLTAVSLSEPDVMAQAEGTTVAEGFRYYLPIILKNS